MKLRLRENSIRLRLLQSEIDALRDNGFVSEEIRFSETQILNYTLAVSTDAHEIAARFEDGKITVEIPIKAARLWAETNLVGLQNEQIVDKNSMLKITIEKDFVCPDRPSDADNADAFPNPKTNC